MVVSNAYPDQRTSPLAHMRLVSTPGSEWCKLGDLWLSEAYNFILKPPSDKRWQRVAQSTLFSAHNAQACA